MVSALAFIWLYRFLPLLDYPDWLYQGWLFSRALRGEPLGPYALSLVPVPNALSTLLIGGLGVVMPIEAAGKVVLSLYAVAYVVAVRTLAPSPLGIVALPFLLSFSLFHGNVNYALSLPPLFLGMAELVRCRDGLERTRLVSLAGASLVLALTHGASFAVLWLVVGAFWLFKPGSRALVRLGIAALPSVVLLLPYLAVRAGGGNMAVEGAPSVAFLLKGKVASIAGYYAPFQGVYPFLDLDPVLLTLGGALNVLVVVVVLALIGWLVLANVRRERAIVGTLLLFAALYVVAPLAIGDFGTPGERLLYPGLMLALALPASRRIAFGVAVGACVVLVAQAGFIHVYGRHVADAMAKVDGLLRTDELGARFEPVRQDTFDGAAVERTKPFYLPLHESLFRLPYYVAIERGTPLPIFQTGMFRELAGHPPLANAAVALARNDLDSLIVLGDDAGNETVARQVAPAYRPVLRERYVLVLRRG